MMVDQASKADVDLQISGHTHGGQLLPFGYLVLLDQPVLAGLTRVGRTWLYVTRGVGFWGPPVRVGAPPEITLLTLRSPHRPNPLPASRGFCQGESRIPSGRIATRQAHRDPRQRAPGTSGWLAGHSATGIRVIDAYPGSSGMSPATVRYSTGQACSPMKARGSAAIIAA